VDCVLGPGDATAVPVIARILRRLPWVALTGLVLVGVDQRVLVADIHRGSGPSLGSGRPCGTSADLHTLRWPAVTLPSIDMIMSWVVSDASW
jgi:hypothetical protein